MGAGRVSEQQSPMQSQVNWALLGLVIERPSYAYELAQRFDRTYEGALSLSSTSHVYTALRALEDRGLVEAAPGSGTGRQPKPCYRASVGAVELYQRWLVSQFQEECRRQRLFALQLGALMSHPELARTVIDGYEQACLGEGSRNRLPSPGVGSPDEQSRLAERLVSEENRLAVGAKLEWARYARAQLDALAPSGTSRR